MLKAIEKQWVVLSFCAILAVAGHLFIDRRSAARHDELSERIAAVELKIGAMKAQYSDITVAKLEVAIDDLRSKIQANADAVNKLIILFGKK